MLCNSIKECETLKTANSKSQNNKKRIGHVVIYAINFILDLSKTDYPVQDDLAKLHHTASFNPW